MNLFVKPLFLSFLSLLFSCSSYRSYYDCPPGKGVGCRSLSEIEAVIEERSDGADYFHKERVE